MSLKSYTLHEVDTAQVDSTILPVSVDSWIITLVNGYEL